MQRFEGKTAVITGAASGIGEATAKRLFAEGGNVVLVDADQAGTERVATELGDDGRTLSAVIDISDCAAVDVTFAAAAEKFGRIDILANCAGITGVGSVMDVTPEMWERIHAVNLKGTLHTLQAFAKRAHEKGYPGSIVNITSIGGMMGVPNRAAYVSTKHAVIGLTREMAMEVGKFGIRVNAIAPGMIRTPMTRYNFEAAGGEENIRRAHPIGRAGDPEEIAAAILFLASDDASFITGAILPADGGYSAGKGWA